MDKTIKRINELSAKSKISELSAEEKIEQHNLRQEYIKGFRNNMKQTLDNTYILDEDGNKTPLKAKNN